MSSPWTKNPNGSTIQTGSKQYWTVPATGTYSIKAVGATGGDAGSSSYPGGKGAIMIGTFSLVAGDNLTIMVGKKGESINYINNIYSAGGGGGGTFVASGNATTLNDVLIVAGGGGGYGYTGPSQSIMDATIITNLPNGLFDGGDIGTPWSSGGGGGFLYDGNGGRYVTQPGERNSGGESFKNGGEGGSNGYNYWQDVNPGAGYNYFPNAGGYGGGGGSGAYNAGGGGGINGGDAGDWYSGSVPRYVGGGGASYNSGINQTNSITHTAGDGYVLITQLTVPGVPIPNNNIELSILKSLYIASGSTNATGDTNLKDPTDSSNYFSGLQHEFVYGKQCIENTATKWYSTNNKDDNIFWTNSAHFVSDNTSIDYFDSTHPNASTGGAGGFKMVNNSADIKFKATSAFITAMSDLDTTMNKKVIYETWFWFDSSSPGADPNSRYWLICYETSWGPALTINDSRISQPNPNNTGNSYKYQDINGNYLSHFGPTPGFDEGKLANNTGANWNSANNWPTQTKVPQGRIATSGGGPSPPPSPPTSFRSEHSNKWFHMICEWKYAASQSIAKTMWLNGVKINYVNSSSPDLDGASSYHNTDTGNSYIRIGDNSSDYLNTHTHSSVGVVFNTIRVYVRTGSQPNMTDTEALKLYNYGIGRSLGDIKLSYFRNATFLTGNPVPSTGAISINTDFKGRTFGGGGLYTLKDTDGTLNRITFTTGNSSNPGVGKHLGTALGTYQTVYNGCGFESNTSHFNVINGIQLWKVPVTGTYEIEVGGGGGGSTYNNNRYGGMGQMIRGTKTLTQGDMLRIIVGSRGGRFMYTAGGGGASAVGPAISMTNAGTASGTAGRWIIAGAGGGGGDSGGNGTNANSSESSNSGNGTYGSANTTWGTGGRSGITTNGGWGGGGAGWTSDGGGNNNAGTGNYQQHYNSRRLNTSSAPHGAHQNISANYPNPFESSTAGSCRGAAGGFGGGGNGACNGSGAGAGYTGGAAGGAGGGSYFNTGEMSSRVNGNIARDIDGHVKITKT